MNLPFPRPLPDDPKKWNGWANYKSANLYERLCLDHRQKPTNDLIEEHCRELLRWWQKKLPLKSQPMNPLTQLLRPGLEESSRYLTQARVGLLNPERRKHLDDELAAQAQEEAIAEFHKFITFAIADGTLTADEEKNLLRFGQEHGLSSEQMLSYIEAELRDSGASRATLESLAPASAPVIQAAPTVAKARDPKSEFMRMLRLTGLDSDGMTDETRDAFINMAENMDLDPGVAEDLVDEYLEEVDGAGMASDEPPQPNSPTTAATEALKREQLPPAVATAKPESLAPYLNSLGSQMLFIPGGEFMMGSTANDAAPNEQPVSRITVGRYYISKHPVTNADYEQFDRSHERKRLPGAGDKHPVVHVSSLEALKFCQWLSSRERKKYRLPTEAEWEFAARGKDGRKYPWGNHAGRGDLANFADKNTVFAWSDREISDGYPESSPVGAFPNGASPFGVLDLAGNVWEWCSDFFEAYKSVPRINPRGAASGQKRVYRGGSWKSRFASLRATARGANVPNYSCNDLGFRIVCECD